LAVHRLGDSRDLNEPVRLEMTSAGDELDALGELLEVALLRGAHRMLPKERNDRLPQLLSPSYDVAIQVLAVIVVARIRDDVADSEEVDELVQEGHALRALRDGELVSHLIAGCVAFSVLPVVLPDEPNREASFSVYKTNNPASEDQPFLLVFRTARIVTAQEL
jgi:hypothetical protein